MDETTNRLVHIQYPTGRLLFPPTCVNIGGQVTFSYLNLRCIDRTVRRSRRSLWKTDRVIRIGLIAEGAIKHVEAAERRADGRLCDWLVRRSRIVLAQLAVTHVVSHVRATEERHAGRHAGSGFTKREWEWERGKEREKQIEIELFQERETGQATSLLLPTGSHMPIHALKTVNNCRSVMYAYVHCLPHTIV